MPRAEETAEVRADGELDVCVVGGCGHVGLPLALAFAQGGLRVGIYDTDAEKVALVRSGTIPFLEAGAPELIRELLPTDRLEFSADPDPIARAQTVLIVIGTPIDEFLSPTLTSLEACIRQVAVYLRDGALVVLRSTVYPGTTERLAQTLADLGHRVDVAFCPERIAEGYALEELRSLPQIVGCDSEVAGDRAASLFRKLTPRIIRTTTKEAEVAKLFTNAWRYMKFAIANQFFTIAHEAGLDHARILDAVRRDYPRARDLPGPGFTAGPCLLKDTMQLAAFTQNRFVMGHAAMLVNEGLPAYVVDQLERRCAIAGTRIGLLGMAFKAESDDVRASLSYKLKKLLQYRGATVLCTDPYVNDDGILPLETVLRESDILIIAAPHAAYREACLDGKDVVDIWNVRGNGISI